MSDAEITICILADSLLDREAYRSLISTAFSNMSAVDSDFNARSVWSAMRLKPQLILVDADSGNGTALEAVEMIQRICHEARIIVMSSPSDSAAVRPWGGREIHGFVTKAGGAAELAAAIDAVMRGRRHFSGDIAQILSEESDGDKPRLTPRELQLLPLLAKGLTLRDAAARMAVSYKTADSHRTRLLRKLGIRDRVELARYAIREKIVEA